MIGRTLSVSAVVLCVSAFAPSAPSAARSIYGGHLGTDDDPIVLTADASGQQLKDTVIGFRARCTRADGSSTARVFQRSIQALPVEQGTTHFGAWEMTSNANGRLAGTYAQPGNVAGNAMLLTVKLSGTLTRASASGTLEATSLLTDAPAISATPPTAATVTVLETCSTGVLRWKAAHRPGYVYGGRTEQDEPLVVRLSKDRKRVADVDVGWHAGCAPAGMVDVPETFGSFRIGLAGRFGKTFTHRYPALDGSGDNVYDYDLHGRILRRSASGSFSARLTLPDGSFCDTGPMAWKASST